MITISVCMIVKNEEEQLDACLKSLVPIADEIIVVDTGSIDRTKEIAAQIPINAICLVDTWLVLVIVVAVILNISCSNKV